MVEMLMVSGYDPRGEEAIGRLIRSEGSRGTKELGDGNTPDVSKMDVSPNKKGIFVIIFLVPLATRIL